MKSNRILFACLALSTTAFGGTNLQTVQLAEVPSALHGNEVKLSTERVSKEVVAPRSYEVPNRSVFFLQRQGGSAAVGLLFGPLGVLANIANIDRATDELGRTGLDTGLYAFDALQEIQAAWGTQAVNATATQFEGVTIKPYIVYSIIEPKNAEPHIQPIIAFRAEARIKNAEGTFANWGAKYIYASKYNPAPDALAKPLSEEDLVNLRNEIRTAYKELRVELLRDLSKEPMPKRKIAWVSSLALAAAGVGGRSDIEQGVDGRLTLRVNMKNYDGLMNESAVTAHVVVVLPTASQYSIAIGPVDREPTQKEGQVIKRGDTDSD